MAIDQRCQCYISLGPRHAEMALECEGGTIIFTRIDSVNYAEGMRQVEGGVVSC